MTRFDPELIAALAEGLLPPDEAAATERAVAADPAAAAELEAQRAALAALGRLPPPSLTAFERADLRSSVADAIGLAPAASPAPAPKRRRIPWPAVAVAALSLVAVVAIVPQTGLLTTGDDDTTTTFAVAGEAPPEAEVAEEHLEAAEPQLVPPSSQDAGGTAFADDGTATTVAEDSVAARSLDPALREVLEDHQRLEDAADGSITACRAEAADILGSDPEPVAAAVPLERGGEAVVWFVPGDEGEPAAAAFSRTDCELLFTNR